MKAENEKTKYSPYHGGMNDLDLARYFITHHKPDVRWLVEKECWLYFDGTRWREDNYKVKTLMQETLSAIANQNLAKAKDIHRRMMLDFQANEEPKSKVSSELKSVKQQADNLKMTERYRAVLDAVKTDELTIRKNELDGHPYLINVKNGVIDFSDKGNFIPHEDCKNFFMTKIANTVYADKAQGSEWSTTPDPETRAADCPEWKKFIEFLFPDQEMQDYVQRMCGYLLTGYVSEQVLFLLLGAGNNGKSMFAMVLQTLLDEYAVSVPFDTLMAQSYDSQLTPHLNRLPGIRLAVISETKVGKAWDSGIVKVATGGDMMTTNPKHKEAYQFKATHKFMVLSNHKPRVNDNSTGFWRRMHIIPFERVIEKPEPFEAVLQRFMNEAPGILNWCIEGEIKRQKHRLTENMPQAITDAVKEYRSEEDVFSDVLGLYYVLDVQGMEKTGDVIESVNAELKKRGHFPLSSKSISAKLQEKGVKRGGQSNMYYLGVRRLTVQEKDERGLPVDDQERLTEEITKALFEAESDK
jgi:putative DNA primase/helicase